MAAQMKTSAVARHTVMGLDVSLTGLGVCVIGPSLNGGATPLTRVWTGIVPDVGNLGDEMSRRYTRIHHLLEGVAALVDQHRPAVIAIEGYSMGSNLRQQSRIVELGAVIRHELLPRYDLILEPTPSQVKKFAAGKGTAKKDEVRLAVYKRWKFEAQTNDEVDAFVLARIAQAASDPRAAGPLNDAQRKVITTLVASLAADTATLLTGLPGPEVGGWKKT